MSVLVLRLPYYFKEISNLIENHIVWLSDQLSDQIIIVIIKINFDIRSANSDECP